MAKEAARVDAQVGAPPRLALPLVGAGVASATPEAATEAMSRGTEKRVRDYILPVRLSEDERAIVDAAAERAGLTTGSYVRQTLLGAPTPRQVRRPPVERRELIRLLAELGKIGSNLNQLAKTANSGFGLRGGEIDAALLDLQKIRNAILAALGRSP